MVAWTNKGLSSSYNRNSTGRHFRTDIETHSVIRLLYFHWAILCISSCLLLHSPRWQHYLCHHICSPGRKKGKGIGQKRLLAEYVSSNKRMAFPHASPGDFHLYLIGRNEVTWILLSPTRESGKCSFCLFLGKAHCHPK